MATSDRIGHIKQNETVSVDFGLDTSSLSAGSYRISLALYYANELGMSNTVDLGRAALKIKINEITSEDRITGDFRLGGYVRLPNLQLKGR